MLIQAFVPAVLIMVGMFLAVVFIKRDQTVYNNKEWQRSKCESPIERKLFNALTYNGYSVSCQVRCGRYRIDLALPPQQIAIECDGKAYHSSPSQKAHDRKKDRYLRDNGWQVLRFTGSQINGNLKAVLQRIETATSKIK